MTQNPSALKLDILNDRMMVQFIRNGIIYSSEDHFVFKSGDGGRIWQKVCEIRPRERTLIWKARNLLLRSALVRTVRRNIGIHNLIVLKSGTILIQYDGIYRYDGSGNHAKLVLGFRSGKIIGPLKNGFVVDDRTGKVYFGEYNNKRPYAVRILRGTDDGRKWEVCHEFPPGRIKHVHTIVPDPYRKRIWICAGDNDQESGLFFTEDDFRSVELFCGGDQTWRMVSMICTEDALYWGSDAGQDVESDFSNLILRWDFRSEQRKKMACIKKPAYYSTQLQDGTMAIGATYEPLSKLNVQASADLWVSPDGERWERMASLPFQPSGRADGTKYGTICFPLGDRSVDRLFFTPLNVRDYDFKLMSAALTQQ